MAYLLDPTTVSIFDDLAKVDPTTGMFTVADYPSFQAAAYNAYRQIFGNDVYLENDSKDGILLSIMALAARDAAIKTQAMQLQQSPLYAAGANLDSMVKINGIRRREATKSQVDVRIVGQAGTVISEGQVQGDDKVKWLLPSTVVIPQSGEITVTALSADFGAIPAPAGYINQIVNPQLGWQSVENLSAATLGVAIATDDELRELQRISTIGSARASLEAIADNLSSVPGVSTLIGYENYTNVISDGINPPYTPAGLPPHSITFVIDGGDVQEIVNAYGRTKASGSNPNGNVGAVFIGEGGVPREFKFYRPVNVDISVQVELKAARGYTNAMIPKIKQAIGNYIRSLTIGDLQFWIRKIQSEAELRDDPLTDTFFVDIVRISRDGGAFVATDLPLAYYERAIIDQENNITITATPQ